MKKATSRMLAVLIMAATLLTGCNSGEDQPYIESFQAIVTYVGSNDSGSTFTTREKDDSPLVTFTSIRKFEKNQLTPSQRCIIWYTNASGKRFESGPINLLSIAKVFDPSVKEADLKDIEEYTQDPMNVLYVERSGTYINVVGTAPYLNEPKVFGLRVDKATLSNPVPDVYVVFQSGNMQASDRQLIGSFDIKSIWDLPTCTGIKVHFKKDGDKTETEVINKTHTPVTPTPDPVD